MAVQLATSARANQGSEDGGDTDHVLIVGAGFAGLGMAIRLKQAGIHDFTVLERSDRLGGVWRDNTYPGIACDIPSHLYSYSFEPNPDWSRLFAPQEEILAYLERCADKYGVREHIRFGTGVTGAFFDERSGLWAVQTSRGSTLTARVLVSGSGHALTQPVYPDVPGRDRFRGATMHSSRWDHTGSLAGKTVAVVGTGASAIQIVPSIANDIGRMHVFQRTASWVQPRPEHLFSDREKERFRARPYLQTLLRRTIYWALESTALGYVVAPRLNRIRELACLRFLRKNVPDPALRAKLTPQFRLGCKRILISSDYYGVLQRDNVELVTEPIAEIREHSIVTRDGKERPVDAIVYATGFETAEAKPPFPMVGRAGFDLRQVWKGGVTAYAGTTISGFPNAFLLLGPNTTLGHSSMIFMMESQFAYILDAIHTIRSRRLKYVDVRRDVELRYNERLQKRLAGTVWNSGGCASWYFTRSGKNTVTWPGFTFEFRLKMRRFDTESYVLAPRSEAALGDLGLASGGPAARVAPP
jgi:cation diffusion facilitator CzcD-associated flavoprotein CzcO